MPGRGVKPFFEGYIGCAHNDEDDEAVGDLLQRHQESGQYNGTKEEILH